MARQSIALLGATGSIGIQTLQVVKHLGFGVEALTGHNNMDLLARQVSDFEPKLAVAASAQKAMELKKLLQEEGSWMPEIMHGMEGYKIAATMGSAGTIVVATGGQGALEPVLAAAKAGKRIALANKESLVVAGQLVCSLAESHGATIFPVDSEHSAIFQCLGGRTATAAGTYKGMAADTARQIGATVRRLILTASGGPFRGYTGEQLSQVKPKDALEHPTWKMGKKITIDSATLMNKGLEVIEAHWLFQVPLSRIQVVVHPQSMIHSMVEFIDGTIMAQCGVPDMRQPIQTALTWPRRVKSCSSYVNFTKAREWTFDEPDHTLFPCLGLAYDALRAGGTMPAVLNGANEGAVEAFMAGKIGFTDIPKKISRAMEIHQVVAKPRLSDYLAACEEGRSGVMAK